MQTATITYPDGGVLSGTFFLASYTDTGAYHDATTFQAELQSSGPVSYTRRRNRSQKRKKPRRGDGGLFGFLWGNDDGGGKPRQILIDSILCRGRDN
jgi:hypothetical protein